LKTPGLGFNRKIEWPIQKILAAEREHCSCPNDIISTHKQYEQYASNS